MKLNHPTLRKSKMCDKKKQIVSDSSWKLYLLFLFSSGICWSRKCTMGNLLSETLKWLSGRLRSYISVQYFIWMHKVVAFKLSNVTFFQLTWWCIFWDITTEEYNYTPQRKGTMNSHKRALLRNTKHHIFTSKGKKNRGTQLRINESHGNVFNNLFGMWNKGSMWKKYVKN